MTRGQIAECAAFAERMRASVEADKERHPDECQCEQCRVCVCILLLIDGLTAAVATIVGLEASK